MGYKSIESRIQRSLIGFKLSFTLSLVGTLIELLVVLFIAYNAVLMADLGHWLIDTILEGLFLLFAIHVSKTRRIFPLSTVVLESILVTTATVTMAGIYGYFIVDYFLTSRLESVSGTYTPILVLVPILGTILTGTTMLVQRRLYHKFKLEILRVDYLHAVIDTIAAAFAVIGVALVSLYQNPGVEAIFVVILSFFVYHSITEVLKDTVRTVTGRNVDPELKLKLYEKISTMLSNIDLRDIDARKIGSFYVVTVRCEVDPKLTIRDAHRLRLKIIDAIRETSDMIYHVDVLLYPRKKPKRKS